MELNLATLLRALCHQQLFQLKIEIEKLQR